MKRKLLGTLVLGIVWFGAVVPVEAQGGRGGARRGPSLDEQVVTLTEQLQLTDEQAVEVRQIIETQNERRRELFDELRSGGGDRSGMRAAMEEVQEETDQMLSEVLNEVQIEKYRKIQAERRQRRGPPPF